MLSVLLVLQIIITIAMIIVILIQRNSSEGMAGLAGGGNSIMSGRASANFLTKITSFLAAGFILNSLVMASITARASHQNKSIIDQMEIEKPSDETKKAIGAKLDEKPESKTQNIQIQQPASQATKDLKSGNDESKNSNESKPKSKPVVPIAE